MAFTVEKIVKATGMQRDWAEALEPEFNTLYMQTLMKTLRRERDAYDVAPATEDVFKAFALCSLENTKVIIVGQDPYPTAGMASGLAFGIHKDFLGPQSGDYEGLSSSYSLDNIIKELEDDVGFHGFVDLTLEHWAKNGVLLLNTALTVRVGERGSHSGVNDFGWKTFMKAVFDILFEKNYLVWLLWGKQAARYAEWCCPMTHWILKAAHPSPLSAHRGFFGCKHFSQTNKLLEKENIEPIDWYKFKTVEVRDQKEDEDITPWDGDPRDPKGKL